MDIILKEDIENLGYKDDVVTVKNGYARNFLIPQGKAVFASAGAKKMLAENLKQRAHKEAKQVEDAQKAADQLKEVKISISAKVGKGNKLFGSVSNANLAEELAKLGHHIERKYIQIQGGIVRATGSYLAHVRLHREVNIDLTFEVVGEK